VFRNASRRLTRREARGA